MNEGLGGYEIESFLMKIDIRRLNGSLESISPKMFEAWFNLISEI